MQPKEQKISPIKQRILYFASTLGISKRDFYSKIGVSRGTLESPTGITEDVMAKFIATFPNVNSDWLLTGKGDMLKTKRTPSNPDNDNPPVCHDEDKNNNPINQVFITDIVEKLLATIKEKDDKIAEQAAYIGRLEERIRQITVEKEKHVADAPIAGIANVG